MILKVIIFLYVTQPYTTVQNLDCICIHNILTVKNQLHKVKLTLNTRPVYSVKLIDNNIKV